MLFKEMPSTVVATSQTIQFVFGFFGFYTIPTKSYYYLLGLVAVAENELIPTFDTALSDVVRSTNGAGSVLKRLSRHRSCLTAIA